MGCEEQVWAGYRRRTFEGGGNNVVGGRNDRNQVYWRNSGWKFWGLLKKKKEIFK